MARKTKYEVERERDAAKALLAEAYAKIRRMEVVPGEFTHHLEHGKFVARPMSRDYVVRQWITQGARDLICDGCDHGYSDAEWLELFVPAHDEVLPPGVDGVIVKYTFTEQDGTNLIEVWPAVRIN